jgi:Tol biopolymer transport system component
MTPPNKKDALGKGIRSLLQNMDTDFKNNKGGLLIKNMGYPINSSKDDLGFSIYKNKGFFSSNRNGSDDIYSFDFIQANIVLKGKLLVDNNCVGNNIACGNVAGVCC